MIGERQGQPEERAAVAESLPWNVSLPKLLGLLDASPGGLSDKAARKRVAKYGLNDALAQRRRPLWRQILDRFANPLILILLFASGLSAWTGEVTSFVIIVVIILLSVVLDVVAAGARREHRRCAAALGGSQGTGAARRQGP